MSPEPSTAQARTHGHPPERRFRLQEDYGQTSNSEITTFITNEFLLELIFPPVTFGGKQKLPIIPIGNLPFSQAWGYFTNHTLPPFSPPRRTYSEVLPITQIFGVGVGKERMLAEFRGALLRSPGNQLPRALGVKLRGKKKRKKSRLAHRGGRQIAAGDFGSAPSGPRGHMVACSPLSGASSRSSSESGTPTEPLLQQTEHTNFKMVPGVRGPKRVARGRGWGALSNAHTAGRRGTPQR